MITRKNDAFDAKIVNTRLRKIFIAIFAPDERLPSSATLLHMWRNFRCLHMTDVEKSEILHIWHVCDVKNVAIYAKFMQFSCGEKLSPKVYLWRKNDKYQVTLGLCISTVHCINTTKSRFSNSKFVISGLFFPILSALKIMFPVPENKK